MARSIAAGNWIDRHHAGKQIGRQQEASAAVGGYAAGIRLQFYLSDLRYSAALRIDAKTRDAAVAFAAELLLQAALRQG